MPRSGRSSRQLRANAGATEAAQSRHCSRASEGERQERSTGGLEQPTARKVEPCLLRARQESIESAGVTEELRIDPKHAGLKVWCSGGPARKAFIAAQDAPGEVRV